MNKKKEDIKNVFELLESTIEVLLSMEEDKPFSKRNTCIHKLEDAQLILLHLRGSI